MQMVKFTHQPKNRSSKHIRSFLCGMRSSLASMSNEELGRYTKTGYRDAVKEMKRREKKREKKNQ